MNNNVKNARTKTLLRLMEALWEHRMDSHIEAVDAEIKDVEAELLKRCREEAA